MCTCLADGGAWAGGCRGRGVQGTVGAGDGDAGDGGYETTKAL